MRRVRPHRQYIRGDAASNEATSVAKLRLAQQGRVVVSPCFFVPSVTLYDPGVDLSNWQSGKVLVGRGWINVVTVRVATRGVPLFFILIAIIFHRFWDSLRFA